MPLGFSPGHFSVSRSNRNALNEGLGFTGCGKSLHGQESKTSGAKADVFSIVYGPTKVVP
jgi:hypothetical protein